MLIFQLVSSFHILELKYLDTLVIDATVVTARLLNHSQISEPTGPALYCLGLFYDSSTTQMFIKFEAYYDWQLKCLMLKINLVLRTQLNKSSCKIYSLVTRINTSTVSLINLSFSCNPNFRLNIFIKSFKSNSLVHLIS